MLRIDLVLFEAINQFAGRFWWLDSLAVFFAKYFEFFLIGSLFLLLALNFKKYWNMVWQSFAAAFFSRFVITDLIRWLWPRPRPFLENQVNLLLEATNAASFPSGHAAFYVALAAVIYFYNKKIGILFFLAAFLISLSRVFAGVHWPSDILAGAIVGIFSGWLIILFSRRFSPDNVKQLPQSK